MARRRDSGLTEHCSAKDRSQLRNQCADPVVLTSVPVLSPSRFASFLPCGGLAGLIRS
jgi:hypothetical protein